MNLDISSDTWVLTFQPKGIVRSVRHLVRLASVMLPRASSVNVYKYRRYTVIVHFNYNATFYEVVNAFGDEWKNQVLFDTLDGQCKRMKWTLNS